MRTDEDVLLTEENAADYDGADVADNYGMFERLVVWRIQTAAGREKLEREANRPLSIGSVVQARHAAMIRMNGEKADLERMSKPNEKK
jgi:hypothetical protein